MRCRHDPAPPHAYSAPNTRPSSPRLRLANMRYEAPVAVTHRLDGSVADLREVAPEAREGYAHRCDEAAGLSLDVLAYAAPQGHTAVNAAERRDQPWTILASTCTRRKARFVFWLW